MGIPCGPFEEPLDHFGAPWVATEVALGCRGAFSGFLTKYDVQFRANVTQVRSLRTKSSLAEPKSLPELAQELARTCPPKWRKPRSSPHLWTSLFERLRCLRTKSSLAEPKNLPELAQELARTCQAKWRKPRSSQPPFTRAGG